MLLNKREMSPEYATRGLVAYKPVASKKTKCNVYLLLHAFRSREIIEKQKCIDKSRTFFKKML